MSRGLGPSQCAILDALKSLEAEHGEEWFRIDAAVDRMLVLSEQLRSDEARQEAARAAELVRIQRLAAEDYERARRFLQDFPARAPGARRAGGRRRERRASHHRAESDFGFVRVLASLERRGLVERHAVRGGGLAKLTAEGRRASTARRAFFK